jgi:L-fuculose-phosphate aldolase
MYSGEFERIGKRLFTEHLVGGNFGNISVRKGDEGFFIKRTGA